MDRIKLFLFFGQNKSFHLMEESSKVMFVILSLMVALSHVDSSASLIPPPTVASSFDLFVSNDLYGGANIEICKS
jgi:hypothetical protein